MATPNDEAIQRTELEFIVQAHALEPYLIHYIQSNGVLFEEECRSLSIGFCDLYDELRLSNPVLYDQVIQTTTTQHSAGHYVDQLRGWANGKSDPPFVLGNSMRTVLFSVITCLKSALISKLKLSRLPPISMVSWRLQFAESYFRWRGHFPEDAISSNMEFVLSDASKSETIAVVGDIRGSQQLMVYSTDNEAFSRMMVRFIQNVQDSAWAHGALFDKFTGDGFVIYFNEYICSRSKLSHVDSFLSFVEKQLKSALLHFSEWTSSLRKVPWPPIGLAMGADIGCIDFYDTQKHLVAVGHPIVWASRLASCSQANEILVNNLLFHKLKDRDGLVFTDRRCEAKAEGLLIARQLQFDDENIGDSPQ